MVENISACGSRIFNIIKPATCSTEENLRTIEKCLGSGKRTHSCINSYIQSKSLGEDISSIGCSLILVSGYWMFMDLTNSGFLNIQLLYVKTNIFALTA